MRPCPLQIISLGDILAPCLGLFLLPANEDGVHHLGAQGHVVVFRVPKHVLIPIIEPDGVAVVQGIHAHAVDIVQIPAPQFRPVLGRDVLGDIVRLPLLLLFHIGVELPADQQVGQQANERHRGQHQRHHPHRDDAPQAILLHGSLPPNR